jgi:DNA-binding response OmpR family regulator
MRHPDRILTRAMIAEHVWDYEFVPGFTNVIDVHIRSLRRRLDDPCSVKHIVTVRGAGYKLVGDGHG